MSVWCECCVLLCRGLSDRLITLSEESYRMWRVVVCDQETSKNEETKAHYRAVKIQPKWFVTPGKQTNKLLRSKTLSVYAYTFDWVTNFYIPLKLCDNISEVILQLCPQMIHFLKSNLIFHCFCLNVATFRTYSHIYIYIYIYTYICECLRNLVVTFSNIRIYCVCQMWTLALRLKRVSVERRVPETWQVTHLAVLFVVKSRYGVIHLALCILLHQWP
jgi:hypothetical protein